MSTGITVAGRRLGTGALLACLLAVALIAALLTPEAADQGGGLSSASKGPAGAGIVYELARRMGWSTARRDVVLDSLPPSAPTVQVVLGPQQQLGAHEVHRLLENVRRGGGLIFTVAEAGEIADSLGLALRTRGDLLMAGANADCPRRSRLAARASSLPPTVHQIVWRRPPPGRVTSLAIGFGLRSADANAAIGFPLGAGLVAAVSSAEVFANSAVATCEWSADLTVARAFDYVRPDSGPPQTMVFDEFHHGAGVHPGSAKAVIAYLSDTRSGRFFATLLAAAALLLFAAAPRPIVPIEPKLIQRRSPLEHADALGRAYADVDATRTATSRLVGGLRRRAGRTVPLAKGADDAAFLDAVVARVPALRAHVQIVRRALTEAIPRRDFAPIGEALGEIEQTLLTSPPKST